MIDSINSIRADNGLRPLREAPKLAKTSKGYAKHLIRSDSFGHGSSFRNAGFRTAGEILAYNSGWSAKPRPAVRMWLRSSSHRALMLSSRFRYVGAGLARGRFGRSMATMWVVHFGAH
ncbi:MAG TPA: CAP domain-containing protein, partial [Thermoleophilaceae bacterium]|nr:CAP domain-containing protein [Thermoleophilaceae bacterium]